MTPQSRIKSAIDVLTEIAIKRRPAADALKDWGLSHRFAGSGDRAAIASLVYDALRRRASSACLLGDDAARAVMLGTLRLERGLSPEQVAALFDGSRYGPSPLTEAERERLATATLGDAPAHVAGDYPDWLDGHLAAVFGEGRAAEGAALAARAPLDLRANALRGDRGAAQAMLAHLHPSPTPWSPDGLRIAPDPQGRAIALKAEPAFLKGHVEIQDEGSQLAALFAAARPGEQVIDLCAGGGGKTLALAAAMGNRGQIFATDRDARRLAPIHARLTRAGVRNVQVRTPRGRDIPLDDLRGRADLVFVDAPCSGIGAWRRNPDAKWRVRPGALAERIKDQIRVLDEAAALVRPGGRIVYVTCSVLHDENGAQVEGFLQRVPGFSVKRPAESTAVLGEVAEAFLARALLSPHGLLMTPHRTGTDGFFVSVLQAGDA